MRISDWSSDVCSSDLRGGRLGLGFGFLLRLQLLGPLLGALLGLLAGLGLVRVVARGALTHARRIEEARNAVGRLRADTEPMVRAIGRSEEHTSELQSLMRISYAVFCLKKKQSTLPSTRLA